MFEWEQRFLYLNTMSVKAIFLCVWRVENLPSSSSHTFVATFLSCAYSTSYHEILAKCIKQQEKLSATMLQ